MLLYIGNMLSKHGLSPSGIETLGNLLKQDYDIKLVSDKRNPLLRILHMLMSLVKYRRRVRFVIIDTYSTLAFYYAFICAFLTKWLDVRYILVLRGGNLPRRYEKSTQSALILFTNAYKIVAPSPYLFYYFKSKGFDNIQLIPNNIEIKNYPFKRRLMFRPKLLWVRSFHKIYNPEMAIKLLAEIKKDYAEATLVMVGPDKDGSMEKCKTLANALDIMTSVTFAGILSKEVWIEISKECDIFVNTTNADNTPISVMEGMALGLPVVSTNVGGIPFMLTHDEDCLLVDQNDLSGMQRAVQFLINNPKEGARISENARKKVEKFDWQKVRFQWRTVLGD